MKAGRYIEEGAATTLKGDPILADIGWEEALTQALGFTPADLSRAYTMRNRAKNLERALLEKKSTVVDRWARKILNAEEIDQSDINALIKYNTEVPENPITTETIRNSVRARARADAAQSGGFILNQRLDRRVREAIGPKL